MTPRRLRVVGVGEGGMKEIPLTQGKVAIVDDIDYETLSVHRWYADQREGRWYARRNTPARMASGTQVYMHRVILGLG